MTAANLDKAPAGRSRVRRALLAAAAAGMAVLAPLFAASTRVWEISDFQDFAPGKFENLSLTHEGRLTLGPAMEVVYSSDQPVIWDAAPAPDGSIYVATGHEGHIYRIDPRGESRLFWDAPEIEVFALAVAPNGDVYAGTSPRGKVYRITAVGEASEFFDPKETYIWSLALAPAKGSARSAFGASEALFAGTGEHGRIFRIDASGKGEVYFETGQRHVMSLAFDSEGRLLAGTDPNGILYRVDGPGKAFTLYDSDLPEIRALQVTPEGEIYAAAMGGGVSLAPQNVPSTITGLGSSAVTTITVSATAEDTPGPEDFKTQLTPEGGRPGAAAVTISQPSVSYSGLEKAALLRIRPGVAVEKIWSSQQENVLALSLDPAAMDQVIFATDGEGRVYRVNGDREVSLAAQAEQDQITRLARTSSGLLLSTAHGGKLYRIGPKSSKGAYQTAVFDTGGISRWGRLSWRGSGGARVEFQTRTGNSGRPDATWSEWSEPFSVDPGADGSAIASPPARFVQWRAVVQGNGSEAVTIDRVGITYLPQNSPPAIQSVEISTAAGEQQDSASKAPAGASSGASYSITVSASEEGSSRAATGSETQTAGGQGRQSLVISWQAYDPDGDPLTAEVHFRGEGEASWKLLKDEISESKIEIDSESLADGTYRFRVTVSDRRANPAALAQSDRKESGSVLVDHTPPEVKHVETGGRTVVRFEVSDTASLLQRGEFSIDAGRWQPVDPDDGILDSRRESFTLRLPLLPEGEHLVTLRVRDRAGNAGLGKAVIR
jgi:hypothetical protein